MEYLTIIRNGRLVIPKQIKDKLHIKNGDFILIRIEKVYGKENLPKHKKVIRL